MEASKPTFEWALRTAREKAAADASFKSLCLSSPKEALEAIGVDVPSDIQVVFSQTSDGELDLHASERAAADALSDADLQAVAGGGIFDPAPRDPCPFGLLWSCISARTCRSTGRRPLFCHANR